ncbi:MAG: TMEM14 family protein [Candidatus Omnitrophica bacterium]|nr:TMEM14 family protein [Candidatus Omnitrophota bacterium]
MAIVFVIYGILMLAGGIFGFVKAGSKASLVVGIVSAILIFAGVGLLLLGQDHAAGRAVLAFTSFGLTAVFALRLFKTRKFMPSGMLLALSLVAFFLAAQLFVSGG